MKGINKQTDRARKKDRKIDRQREKERKREIDQEAGIQSIEMTIRRFVIVIIMFS